LALSSCSVSLAPAEYVAWIEEEANNLRQVKEISNIQYQLQYRPLNYIAAKEKRKVNLPEQELLERTSKLKGSLYFSLRLNLKNNAQDILLHEINGEQDYFARVSYCNAAMADDIKLVDGKDTLACSLFQYVPNYGVAPFADFVFAFEDKETKGDKTILFNDRLFGAGNLQFQFKEEDIENIPEIITE